MPQTADGLTYPLATGHTRMWEHIQALADTVQARFNKPNTIFLAAGDLAPLKNVQTLRDTGLWGMWQCTDANNQGASGAFVVPSGWAAGGFALDLYWTLATAGAGNVTWRGAKAGATDGVALASGIQAVVTAAAPAVDTLKVTTLGTGLGAAAGQIMNVVAERRGADATDTATGAAGIVGLLLRPV